MSLGAFNKHLFAIAEFSDSLQSENGTRPKLTSYSFRRLGPTVADACNLLWHERLPFGNWSSSGLAKEERELARKARMPLLYADSSTKDQAEIAVKSAVWGLVDSLDLLESTLSGEVSWATLSPSLREALTVWRFSDTARPVLNKLCEAATPAASVEASGSLRAASPTGPPRSSSSSSTSSSSSSRSPSVDSWSDPEPESAALFTEFLHGQDVDAKVHFRMPDGSVPACARTVNFKSDGTGIGRDALLSCERTPCKTCCARFATTPRALLKLCNRD